MRIGVAKGVYKKSSLVDFSKHCRSNTMMLTGWYLTKNLDTAAILVPSSKLKLKALLKSRRNGGSPYMAHPRGHLMGGRSASVLWIFSPNWLGAVLCEETASLSRSLLRFPT